MPRPVVVAVSNGHHWIDVERWNRHCCINCGVLRRTDDSNAACNSRRNEPLGFKELGGFPLRCFDSCVTPSDCLMWGCRKSMGTEALVR